MTYASWEPRFRVTTIKPGKLDLFTVTFIDGKRATIGPITEYGAALAKAATFHREHPCQIKVLPMTGPELSNLINLQPPSSPSHIDPGDRQLVIDTLTQVARESNDPDARSDAIGLLTDMGVFKP